jgi:Flp pilus assembly protein TadD
MMSHFSFRQFSLCSLALCSVLLSACAIDSTPTTRAPIEDVHTSTRPINTQSIQTPNQNTTTPIAPNMMAKPDAPPRAIDNPAVASLLENAEQARAQGDVSRAQTLAERAQTLAPHEARAYLELSRIYEQRGNNEQAKQMALRGLSVVHDDPVTEYELQQMSAQ